MRKHIVLTALLLLLSISFVLPANASTAGKPREYGSIVKHLKSKYRAKKVKVPFMWLARFAVSVVKPAGVKSFSLTLFEDLKFSSESIDREMQGAMKNAFGTKEWNSILRSRTAEGQQVYLYMRESGKNVKIAMVAIDKENAAIIRATFSAERLAEFVNDPKVFGISLNESKGPSKEATSPAKAN
jgi:hypothetical protein